MSKVQETRRKPTSEVDDGDFTVEAIVDERNIGTHKEYCVKWEGFTSEENTWEPMTNLQNCTLIIKAWKSSDKFKELQRERRQRGKKTLAESDSTITQGKRLGIERCSSLPGTSTKVREQRDNAGKRFKGTEQSSSQSLISMVLNGLPAMGRTLSSKSDSHVEKASKASRDSRPNSSAPPSDNKKKASTTSNKGLDSPLLTSLPRKRNSRDNERESPSAPVEPRQVVETDSKETQTPDNPMTRIIPKELLAFEEEIERLRSRAEFAVSVKGRMLPTKKPEDFDPDDALVMVTFKEDGAEEAAIFLQRVVKFVMPLLLIKFYKTHTDGTLNTEVDLENFR
ncbi:hypothetical protein RvY_10368 [Ramazzottius varieornatus]|uniref:Chromo domain-containing protein n=1 Tax=Ramazzottius varieornatus TaxID=947166 RepID=A0A1D1VEL7_RAMVA|nr:hypothetical protein RvY_10368 [Ramazzottius varieornatus]